MKILIISKDCVYLNNEYIANVQLDITNYNFCNLEYCNIPINWNNITIYNNYIYLNENGTQNSIIYLSVGKYVNFNQLTSELMKALNIQSQHKN